MPGAFDTHRPPSRELLDDCVHCGFCLPTCPTYQLWGEEMDSPRGRIYLMSLAEQGEIGLEGPFATHIDRCLGCMACVTACPSGVQYDRLLEATRPQVERAVERDKDDKLFRDAIFALFPYKRRLRAAAVPGGLYQALRKIPAIRALAERLPGRLAAMESLLPPVSVRDAFARLPVHTPRRRDPRAAGSALLTGCVQDVFFHRVNAATVRVLAAEGWDVLVPRDQQCCGALEFHSGREEPALARARREIGVYSDLDVDYVVTNVAGCGSSMKEYGHLLDDDAEWAERAKAFSARVRDVHEVLAEGEPRAARHPVRARVAYHDACHLGHAQKVRAQPRAVLRSIPGVELLDLPEAELCCGSAGIYNMVAPEAAGELGARKAENIAATRPDIVVTANPGCLLQIGKHLGVDVPLLHPVQLLDASIRGVPGTPHVRHQRLPDLVTARTLPGMSGLSLAAYQQQPDAIGGSLGLSALVSLLPLAVVLVLLGGFKVRRPVGRAGRARDRVAGRDTRVRHARGHGGVGRAARGVLRPVPDHVDRGQRLVDLQHDGGHRPLRRAAPQLRRVLGGPAHAGDPHRVLLRRPAGGARGLRRTGRDHVGDARRAGLRADARGRSWRSWPTPRPSRSGRWRCRSSRWRR